MNTKGVRSMAHWIGDRMREGDRRDAAQFLERARGDSMRNLLADGWPEWSGYKSPSIDERDAEEDAIAAGLTWPGKTCTPACGYCGACT